VYNGEGYLVEALDSLLSQTFVDFELIISDNASTDSTPEVCQAYAAMDPRICYVRSEQNLGASWNFNRVFGLATGEYFKWAAHDDLCDPLYLEGCVDVLDHDPSIVLCHSRTKEIDEHGEVRRYFSPKTRMNSPNAHERFYECICVPHPQVMVFGLIRADVLKRTRLIGGYASSDRVLLGELALLGRFYELPQVLFFRRAHPRQSFRAYGSRHSYRAWFDPSKEGKVAFPHWRLLLEHLTTVTRARLPWRERLKCYVVVAWWVRLHWKYLLANLVLTEPSVSPQKAPVMRAELETD
jgi:glycosyltransferase involved in cell wall biosynthesis